tara:strand:- start:14991 stop:15134 length:144 start_codon:yes stop_codon:yes gene_type:complete
LVIADDMGLDATPNFAEDLNAIKPNMPTLQGLMDTVRLITPMELLRL